LVPPPLASLAGGKSNRKPDLHVEFLIIIVFSVNFITVLVAVFGSTPRQLRYHRLQQVIFGHFFGGDISFAASMVVLKD
jgi:hypothetical protein